MRRKSISILLFDRRLALLGILSLTAMSVFVPFSPVMPYAGIDASFAFALSQAYGQGLIFGTDVVFNFGPYATVYTKMYPSTDLLAMASGTYLAFCYSGCLWVLLRPRPRPVIQSYSAYAPELIELNRRHLTGPEAPDTVFFSVEPIDGRLPMLDDGASWPLLIHAYSVVATTGKIIQLRRKNGNHEAASTHAFTKTTGLFNMPVTIPSDVPRVFARIVVEPTGLGRLVALLYRPPLLQIRIDMSDGRHREFRFVSGIAKAGFLVSPLVTSNEEFAKLFDLPTDEHGRVRSFTLTARDQASWFWNPEFSVSFESL